MPTCAAPRLPPPGRTKATSGRPGGLDATALRTEVERAIQALEEVRKIKVQLKNASTGIENARGLVDSMTDAVRGHLAQANALLDAAEPEDD